MITALVGIALILLGSVALGYQGFTYVSHDTLLDAGAVQVKADREHTASLPPIVGGIALAAGIVLTVVGLRKSNAGLLPF